MLKDTTPSFKNPEVQPYTTVRTTKAPYLKEIVNLVSTSEEIPVVTCLTDEYGEIHISVLEFNQPREDNLFIRGFTVLPDNPEAKVSVYAMFFENTASPDHDTRGIISLAN